MENFVQLATVLSPTDLQKLYANSTSSLFLFRQLSDICRQLILELIFLDCPVPHQVLVSPYRQQFYGEFQQACDLLIKLNILIDHGSRTYTLGPTFRNQLALAIYGSKVDPSADVSASPEFIELPQDEKHPRDPPFLLSYAKERWELILSYMVSGEKEEEDVTESKKILLDAGLISFDSGGAAGGAAASSATATATSGTPGITSKGFQFLLMGTRAQLWFFLLRFLYHHKNKGSDMALILNLLIQLNCSIIGRSYSSEAFSELESDVLQSLREFGFVYQRKRKDGRFYPTPHIIGLMLGKNAPSDALGGAAAAAGDAASSGGYIVVETNYRLYAYTDSAVQTALVALFSRPIYRFPGLLVANISRDSVSGALANGITAQQIIEFLRQHAHPEMSQKHGSNVLPVTLVDQLQLWEGERRRVVQQRGQFYSDFDSDADYNLVLGFARRSNALLYENAERRVLVVTPEGHDEVKRLWKQHKRALAGNIAQ